MGFTFHSSSAFSLKVKSNGFDLLFSEAPDDCAATYSFMTTSFVVFDLFKLVLVPGWW